MLTGRVSRAWAAHHHPQWVSVEERVDEGAGSPLR
jgi:cytochrome b subunit of formate dehydrogenase